jgi:hypothetical protein
MTKEPNSDSSAPLRRAIFLISLLCDESINAEQLTELEGLILADRDIRKRYVLMMHLHAGLYQYASALGTMQDLQEADKESPYSPLSSLNETMVLPAISEAEAAAEERDEPIYLPKYQPPDPGSSVGELALWKKGLVASIILGLGIGVAVHFSSTPPTQLATPLRPTIQTATTSPAVAKPAVVKAVAIATIVLTNNPVLQSGKALSTEPVTAGQGLVLASGVVELKLARGGGRVVVEGPADITFDSDLQITVRRGRIAATIPGGGLVVRCPYGSVKDLGTQFGIAVGGDGATDVEVIEGRVSTSIPSTATTARSRDIVLSAGAAATISRASVKVVPDGAIPQRFIFRLANRIPELDVVDLISGGDGTTHRNGFAVDPTTGAAGVLAPNPVRLGDHRFHPVTGIPVIDGAFVPDGSVAAPLDSAGDTFLFPPTRNECANNIMTGPKLPWYDEKSPTTFIRGVDYALDPHSIICIHSNSGITLDLDAIRRLHSDATLSHFRCMIGNSFVPGSFRDSVDFVPHAGVFVLVDGKARFANPSFTPADGLLSVDVPLAASDRFLTMASIDDHVAIQYDWLMWVDAKVTLQYAK